MSDVLAKINRLQRQLIVHSVIYYDMNHNIWTDHQWDAAALELVALKTSPEWAESQFKDVFDDFDGSTGYQLTKVAPAHFTGLCRQLIDYDINQK